MTRVTGGTLLLDEVEKGILITIYPYIRYNLKMSAFLSLFQSRFRLRDQ